MKMKIKMHKYLKVALAVSAVVIPVLNIIATSVRPKWSVGGEICILPFAIMIAGWIVKAEERDARREKKSTGKKNAGIR